MPTIKPRNSNVLFRRLPKEDFISYGEFKIYLPDSQNYGNIVCEILDVGPGEWLRNGEREKMGNIKPGDLVVIHQHNGKEVSDGIEIADITEIDGIVLDY